MIEHPAHILCVDDDAVFLRALARALTNRGYQVSTCENAATALARIRHRTPDLAIIDIMMPGPDGLVLTEKITRRSRGRIPVILLSALDSDEAYYEGHVRGAGHVLTKPCSPSVVLAAVRSTLCRSDADP